jgi:chemotaxis protein histidine kinase CheA
MTEHEETIAELRREFSAGLPHRLEQLDTALASLRDAPSRAGIETFYLQAHSLKGTANAYGATELAECATHVSSLAGAWYDAASVPAEDLGTAAARLDALRNAVADYQEQLAAGEGS